MAKSEAGADNNALATFAEDLGKLLGQTERKASEWLSQRQAVANQLTAIRDKASDLLSQLGEAAASARRGRAAGKRAGGRPAKAARKGRKRRKLSAETRKKMADAARKRWAARKKAQG